MNIREFPESQFGCLKEDFKLAREVQRFLRGYGIGGPACRITFFRPRAKVPSVAKKAFDDRTRGVRRGGF